MRANLFLNNWADLLGEEKRDDYLDYNALLQSDEEFLELSSLYYNADESDFEFCDE